MRKFQNIADHLFGRPWAIVPEYFETMRDVVLRRIDGGSHVDFESAMSGLDAKLGVDLDAPEWILQGGQLVDGVAVIPVHGVMSRRMNLFMYYSGGVSTEMLWGAISSALDDDTVDAIVLDIDSPGGAVNGSFSLAENVFAARGRKPMVSIANGLAASAAYLLASATDAIVVNESGEVGSIGVILTHVDFSKANEADGVKTTYIYRGHYKVMGNSDEPLDKESRAFLQDIVDEAYTLFVDKVARNRGLSSVAVMATEAKTFMGSPAGPLGLGDMVGEMADAIARARSMVAGEAPPPRPTGSIFAI